MKVYPFNQLPNKLPSGAWRIFVNKVRVNEIFDCDNSFKKDLFLQGYTDQIIEKLVKDIGWEDDFNEYCQNILNNL